MPPLHAPATTRRRRRADVEQIALAYSIEEILRELPSRHRAILVATIFRGRTTRQAAGDLKIADEDVRRRVYHATRELTAAVVAARRSRPDELPPTEPSRWRRGRGPARRELSGGA